MKHREQSKEKEDAGLKKYLIKKKYQWIRLLLVVALLIAAMSFGIYTAGIQMPYALINIGLIGLIAAGLIYDFKFNTVLSVVMTVLVPILCFYLLEGYSHFALVNMAWQIQILNIILYALIFVLMAGISGNFARAGVITAAAEMAIGLINYYTVNFRQTPILPWDLLSVKTALSVTGNYTFKLPGEILMIAMLFILLAVIASKICLDVKGLRKRLIVSFAGVFAVFLYAAGIQTTQAGKMFGLDDILFTPNVLYRNNGFMVAFTVNMQYLKIDKPAGYNDESRKELAEQYTIQARTAQASAGGDGGNGVTGEEKLPNIIVIMNESFSDLADIAEFETNQDYMPFIHSMEEGAVDNVVSGDFYVSVLGGNTANSEFEFLSGNTMAFLPPGSIAYQQYINDRMPSMAWTLQGCLNYETLGMHPYYASGWDRDEVYPYLGFQKTLFKEQITELASFKGSYGYLRKYISDQAVTDLIIEEYQPENRSGQQKFTFAVTMQNHGGYFDEYANFKQEIELLNVKDDDYKFYTDMYLSLIKKSDEALENLVQYFETYDEPTIILFFGDHQPGNYVIRSIYDTEKERTIEESQQRYVVPFVMWANYDIEDEHIDKISANYLQTLLFEKAGIPLTGYQSYLADLRKTLPVITANVLIDKDGVYYASGESHPYEELLSYYEAYQYNYMFDEKNRYNEFFGDVQ